MCLSSSSCFPNALCSGRHVLLCTNSTRLLVWDVFANEAAALPFKADLLRVVAVQLRGRYCVLDCVDGLFCVDWLSGQEMGLPVYSPCIVSPCGRLLYAQADDDDKQQVFVFNNGET